MTGGPGVGKTTIVKAILRILAEIAAGVANESVRHQIIIASQYALDVDCCARRGIGICSARGQHTHSDQLFSARSSVTRLIATS